jgi:hypothetical protein
MIMRLILLYRCHPIGQNPAELKNDQPLKDEDDEGDNSDDENADSGDDSDDEVEDDIEGENGE